MPARLLIFSSEDADMRYATGLRIPDPFIWIRLEQKEYILVSRLEYGRARKEARRGTKVLLWEDLKLDNIRKPSSRKKNLADIAAAFLLAANATIVDVPERMWAVHLDALREQGIRPRIVAPYFPERLVKTPEEIRHIKATGLATKRALKRAVQVLKESTIEWDDTLTWKGQRLTSETLRQEIEASFLAHDCMSGETIAACGEQSAEPHNRGSGPLYAGKPIILDLFPRNITTGYFFDCTRTVVKGTPSKELKKMYATVRKAQQDALDAIAPGKARGVHEAAAEAIKAAGYATTDEEGFLHGTGHGLGLEIHEPPRLSASSEDVLLPGMIVTVEPGLYSKEQGGVRIEDTVLVTKDGCVNLTNLPKGLIIP